MGPLSANADGDISISVVLKRRSPRRHIPTEAIQVHELLWKILVGYYPSLVAIQRVGHRQCAASSLLQWAFGQASYLGNVSYERLSPRHESYVGGPTYDS